MGRVLVITGAPTTEKVVLFAWIQPAQYAHCITQVPKVRSLLLIASRLERSSSPFYFRMNDTSITLADFLTSPRMTRHRGLSNVSRPSYAEMDDEDAASPVYEDGTDSASAYEEDLIASASTSTSKQAKALATTTISAATNPPTTTKRGRKPAPSSTRAARELARKTNHSRIEKRRREKMNEAMQALRDIVPVSLVVPQDEDEDGAAAGAGGGEKAFKLEVLERTVVFVRGLVERVKALEEQVVKGTCARCDEGVKEDQINPVPNKRRRTTASGPPSPQSPSSTVPLSPPFNTTSVEPPRRPSRPSILFMLNQDQQLPSPPYANDQGPATSSTPHLPPSNFTLPSPASNHSLPSSSPTRMQLDSKGDSWTPDEETAASLLMQISNNRTPVLAASSSSENNPTGMPILQLDQDDVSIRDGGAKLPPAHTPGSVLGM